MHVQMSCDYCRWRQRCSRAMLENSSYGQFRPGVSQFDASSCEVRSDIWVLTSINTEVEKTFDLAAVI